MRGAVLAAALVLCFSTIASAELGRDDQWRYVPAQGERGAMAELRGDWPEGVPSVLIFQIECRRIERTLVFRYFYNEAAVPVEPMELLVSLDDVPIHDDIPFRMPTRRSARATLEGRLALNAEIAAKVRDAAYLMIYAPSDLGEPWHAGTAPALRRLTRECWETPG